MNKKEYKVTIKPFTKEMVKKLLENDHKGGWDCEENLRWWGEKLEEEFLEVMEILDKHTGESCSTFTDIPKSDKKKLIHECADIANIAFMIASNAGLE